MGHEKKTTGVRVCCVVFSLLEGEADCSLLSFSACHKYTTFFFFFFNLA